MGVIPPSSEGKTYSIWKLLLNYSLFSMQNKLHEDYDPGFRATIVLSSWTSIESISKECLYELIMTSYDKIVVPKEYRLKRSVCFKIKNIGKSRAMIEDLNFNKNLELKEKLANYAKFRSWNEFLKLYKEMEIDIEKKIPSWEFIINLYRFRNGIVHGQSIKIMKSNIKCLDDEVSREYEKSINYLDNKKIIDRQLLFQNQDIKDLLNIKLTNFIIKETAKAIDDITGKFHNTFISSQWNSIRN